MRKIDAFAHILPRAYFERLERQLEHTMAPSQLAYYREGIFSFDPVLTDLDARWRTIEPYGDEYAQILVLAVPPLEEVRPSRRSWPASPMTRWRTWCGGIQTASPASRPRCRCPTSRWPRASSTAP